MIRWIELNFAITTRTVFRVIIKTKYNSVTHLFLFFLDQNIYSLQQLQNQNYCSSYTCKNT